MKASLAVQAAAVALLAAPLCGCNAIALASGLQSCSRWTADKAAGGMARANQRTWAGGLFKSIYDHAQRNPNLQGKGLNFQRNDGRLLADLDAYCASHPAASIAQAGQAAAMQEMGAVQAPPPPE